MSNKKLGFGLMRLPLLDPNDDGSIDMEQMKQMVDSFLEPARARKRRRRP